MTARIAFVALALLVPAVVVVPAAEAATLATASGAGNGWVAFKVTATSTQTATLVYRATGPVGENVLNFFFTNAAGVTFAKANVLVVDRDSGFFASIEGPANVAVTHGSLAGGQEPYAWIDVVYQVQFSPGTWVMIATGAGTQNGWSALLDGGASLSVVGTTSGSSAILREPKDFRGPLNVEAYDAPELGGRALYGASTTNSIVHRNYGLFIALSPKYACAGFCAYPPPVASLSVTNPGGQRTTATTLHTIGYDGDGDTVQDGTMTGIDLLGGFGGLYRYALDYEAEVSSAFGTGNPCPGTLGCTRPHETKIFLAVADVRLPA